ncbi:MAG: hypothetical protein IKU15_02160 [Clostridia bacterium]|nr:hypothetical protein [Clostridia bacterium]
MAQNLFEKYGIKEVADVTLYRIERKDETYESQRKISISSILKGALAKETVYPLDEDGKGVADGYEAYVFKDADVLTHFNYDCDDVIEVKGSALFIDTDAIAGDEPFNNGDPITGETLTTIKNYLIADEDSDGIPNLFDAANVTVLSLVESQTNRNIRDRLADLLLNGYAITGMTAANISGVTSRGTTGDANAEINTKEIITLKSDFVCPIEMDGITKANLVTYVGENGSLTWDNDDANVLTEGYITFTAPADATPEEIMGRFQLVQKGLYDDLGVVVRLTQPVRTGGSTESTFTGTITVAVTYDPSVTPEDEIDGTLVFTFTDAEIDAATEAIINAAKNGSLSAAQVISLITLATNDDNVTVSASEDLASHIGDLTTSNITVVTVTVSEDFGYNKFLVTFTATLTATNELTTGRYDLGEGEAVGHYAMDRDRAVGTHEFSYPEQVCMLFAKNQNLITKAGTRYQFANPNQLFGGFEFDDNFATAPNGKERVVVVGLVGRISENLYDLEEVDEAIKELRDTIEAKAYDITYTDYAELLVEDEMGYYLPQQLGYYLDKKSQTVSFFDSGVTYGDWSKTKRGTDLGIYNAVNTWGDDTHYSINDAIDALKEEQKLLDGGADFAETGYTRVFGGYKVTGKASVSETPLDDVGRGVQYEDYTLNGVSLNDIITGKKLSSLYNLDSVIQALSVADLDGQVGQIRITSTAQMESNRAIYVNPDNGVLANRANIYLLKNINARAIAGDKVGIFEFYDKKGNRLYYQDKVFAGTAYLALVVIGTYGLVFVVNRHCTKNVEKVAWMINDNGYITDKQAERIVKNGLIHTVDITVCDETFDATCTVGSIKIRRTKKNVLRYIPVLFLDTLKVSTLEQASEKTDATGGRGNAKLITWDYGKEITLSIEDALYTPASMAAIWAGEHGDLKNGVKDTTMIDRMEKITAKRNFIIPAGNHEGTPSEGNVTAQAVYYDPKTMEPFQDGTPIAEGEVIYKFTRSVAYEGNSIGNTIEISADKFPGTYRVVGETLVRDKATGEDQRFQFIIPEAKMSAESTSITLEADGDPVVFSFTMDVLRPDNGVMMKFVQFDVVDNDEENDGSTMVKDTENLNLLDDAEMYKVSGGEDEELVIGATEY